MPTASRPSAAWFALLGAMAFVYFVLYPEDLTPLLHPVERALNVSFAISPWLYAVLGVGVLSWAVVRTWGRWPEPGVRRDVLPPPPGAESVRAG